MEHQLIKVALEIPTRTAFLLVMEPLGFLTAFIERWHNLYLVFVLTVCISVYYLNSLFALRNTTQIPTGKRFLLVIAHPDDECMFFSPTVINLTSHGNSVSILCLSSGNADGLGKIREKELLKSCTLLGCERANVHLLDKRELQDSMSTSWDSKAIGRELHGFFKAQKQPFDVILTFDEYGVSSHPNHTSILPALKQFITSQKVPAPQTKPLLFKLLTTNLPRKYAGIMDAMTSLLLITYRVMRAPGRGSKKKENFMCFMSDPWQVLRGQRAMVQGHRSQLRWFRWFWIVIGRYMYINELERVPTV